MPEKIGIITFHRADNLGAVLQAYALCEFINEKQGVNVEIIDYRCEKVEETRRYKGNNIFKKILMNRYYAIKRKGFDSFRKNNLSLSAKKYDLDNIKLSNNEYSVFISGSDQVWNTECSGNDYSFFLDFANEDSKKIAYAPSIGTSKYSEKMMGIIQLYLKRFDALSAREKNVVEQFNLDIDTPIMPDPVFLLDEARWSEVGELNKNNKYVFVYLIQDDVNVMREATKYAKNNKCKMIVNKKSLSFILNNSPEKFIGWVAGAEAVFTNSFHGTAFSMLFHKKLGADIELKDGRENNRIKEMLTDAKLGKCIITNNFTQPTKAIADEWIEKQRGKAEEYLKTSIVN